MKSNAKSRNFCVEFCFYLIYITSCHKNNNNVPASKNILIEKTDLCIYQHYLAYILHISVKETSI